MTDQIRSIEITFPADVEFTDDDMNALVDIADRICTRYKAAHPGRTMWPAGTGSRPLNIWTASDDEPIEFDTSTFSIDCAERADYDWPCAKCGREYWDHRELNCEPPAGDCKFEPAARRKP